MGTQTDRFYDEIKRSHTVLSYVDVIAPDLEAKRLHITDGEVDVDRTAQVRRSIQITCIDPLGEVTPRNSGEILTPYGTELRAYRGVRYSDGTTEVAPLGVFRLAMSTITDGVGGTSNIQLQGYDRSRTVSRDKFTSPYTVASGTNVLTAIQQIIARTFPDAQYDAVSTTLVTTAPMLFDSGADPWDAATQLATSMGCEVYFDVEGRVAISPPPDINALPAPDFEYIEGQQCSVLDLTRVFTDEPGFNGVIVTGETPGDSLPPVRGETWDESPTSPTYHNGPYGEVPTFITDATAKTQEDCERIAKSQLALILGYSSQLTATTIVNPSYEGGAVIKVKRKQAGIDGLYVLDSFVVPFAGSATQTLTMRERRAV